MKKMFVLVSLKGRVFYESYKKKLQFVFLFVLTMHECKVPFDSLVCAYWFYLLLHHMSQKSNWLCMQMSCAFNVMQMYLEFSFFYMKAHK